MRGHAATAAWPLVGDPAPIITTAAQLVARALLHVPGGRSLTQQHGPRPASVYTILRRVQIARPRGSYQSLGLFWKITIRQLAARRFHHRSIGQRIMSALRFCF
ncbi:hypothetical protein EDC01DRAFT_785653 [Geopyxis carbonaria]|nr:hypothetical protein EDC01DRAFT_785653 [Geopyxis carbonaria]